MLNITSENSINTMKKSNIINKDIRVDNEIRSEIVRNTVESQMQTIRSLKMMLQTIIYQIQKFETFM